MKDLCITYRDDKFIHLVIDGVEMKHITSLQFSHAVGEEVPSLTVSGSLISGRYLSRKEQELVEK